MYALLGLYGRPYSAQEPVVCVDEKSKQLLRQTRATIAGQPGRCAREDYEYQWDGKYLCGRRSHNSPHQSGRCGIRQEPAGNSACGCGHRSSRVGQPQYSFPEDLGGCVGETAAVAEVEIGIMDRQCTGQRIAAAELSQREIARWQVQGNAAGRGIEWKFTGQDADRKPSRHDVL